MNNNNYYPYGSQPPYTGGQNQPFQQNNPGYPPSNQNIYPNISGYPQQQNNAQYASAPFSGVNPNPQQRPYAPSQPSYPNQPSFGQNPYPSQPGYGNPTAPYPNSQNFNPPQPNYGYPPQNPMYPNNQMPSYGNQGYGMNPRWDERTYLKQLFDEIDHNKDGRMTVHELHEALRRGQTNFEFDPYTVQFLIQKYDNNKDNEIAFNEFYDLYCGLSVQYNEFLDVDQDSSGLIDSRELSNSLRRKGFNFSQEVIDFIVNEISRRSGKHGISFDIYVRVTARFENLRNEYNRLPYKNIPLDIYIRDRFF
ncbi:unnamed protein product [Brachionus calyciflorus]|uniref:EF-hand domain-containing protein n=1 Tax=Brachionus calyciflorus TaxID=104777 RepID=A0A814E956_9BILA|nr:unnamed protein product [Brachionus calyciflorus]